MSKTIHLALLIATLLIAANTHAANLCYQQEEVIFSCDIGKKIVSICSSKSISSEDGYLKYRYGKSNEQIELEYPSRPLSPQESFELAEYDYAKGTIIQLSFKTLSYTYTLDLQSHVYRNDWSGIVIEKNGEKIKELKCNIHNQGFELFDKLKEIGLPIHETRDLGTSTP